MDEVIGEVESGATIQHVAFHYPSQFIRYHGGIRDWFNTRRLPEPRDSIKVFYVYGSAGTGKTRACTDLFPGAYVWPTPFRRGNPYAYDYAGQKVTILDDYDSFLSYPLFLRVCDRYPLSVNVCGSSAVFESTIICITSNEPPEGLHLGDPGRNWGAIERRITLTIHSTQVNDEERIKRLIKEKL